MKKRILGILSIIIITGFSAYAASPQTTCPICKGSINKALHVDYHGKRVYFGCAGCPEEFLKNPDKYMSEMKAKGVELSAAPTTRRKITKRGKSEYPQKIQTECPYSGKTVNRSVYTDVSGKRVYFCGNGCKANFMKNPKENLKKFEKKGMKFKTTAKE